MELLCLFNQSNPKSQGYFGRPFISLCKLTSKGRATKNKFQEVMKKNKNILYQECWAIIS